MSEQRITLRGFVAESNRIEGILRHPRDNEIEGHELFLEATELSAPLLEGFVENVAGAELRKLPRMDVRVGAYFPPPGGPGIVADLEGLLCKVEDGDLTPWETYVAYENLHPFMDGNGRSGRLLWAWQMQNDGLDAFALPILHRMHYQALEASNALTSKIARTRLPPST